MGAHVHSSGRPASRRACRCLPAAPQLPLLKARWKQVLFGALFQYVHGIFTQLAHRMHQPQEQPLGDVGFKYLPVGTGRGAELCTCRRVSPQIKVPLVLIGPQAR